MDQKAAYEQTITEKLELLTVPDMVDAIWARIETQLDIDMPPEEGPQGPPGTPPAGTGSWSRVVMTIFVAALVATIYFTNRKTNTDNNNPTISPDNPAIITAPNNTNAQPPPAPDNLPSPRPLRLDETGAKPLLPGPDSLGNDPTGNGPGVAIPDSFAANPVVAPPPGFSSADTSQKKSRGVKGIKDADYRITPVKQDSTE